MLGRLWNSGREAAFDVGLWLGLQLLALLLRSQFPSDAPPAAHAWLGGFWVSYALATLAGAVLLVRRRYPLVGVVVAATAVVAHSVAVAFGPGPLLPINLSSDPWLLVETSWIAYSFAVYAVGRRKRIAGWVLLGVLVVVASRPWTGEAVGLLMSVSLVVLFPAVLGLYVAARRRLVQALRERAERAEREQGLLARQARADERARLAVEMHDVVTHRMSLMVLRAGALGVTAADEPTREAAEDLRASGCQALEELRDLIGVLREDDDADEREEVDTRSVLDLSGLVAEAESAGMRVELVEEGNPAALSPAVGRTAHRVVREALTNVGKHARNSDVRVRVRYGGDRVRLVVRNSDPSDAESGSRAEAGTASASGPGSRAETADEPGIGSDGLAATGSGSGLLGLRQRVELVGGDFEAGPAANGGFELVAQLPAYVPTEERTAGG